MEYVIRLLLVADGSTEVRDVVARNDEAAEAYARTLLGSGLYAAATVARVDFDVVARKRRAGAPIFEAATRGGARPQKGSGDDLPPARGG